MWDLKWSSQITVILSGEHKVSEWDRTELAVAVSRYHIHPEYSEENWLFDFAILTLLQPLHFPNNPSIRWWQRQHNLADDDFLYFPGPSVFPVPTMLTIPI